MTQGYQLLVLAPRIAFVPLNTAFSSTISHAHSLVLRLGNLMVMRIFSGSCSLFRIDSNHRFV